MYDAGEAGLSLLLCHFSRLLQSLGTIMTLRKAYASAGMVPKSL